MTVAPLSLALLPTHALLQLLWLLAVILTPIYPHLCGCQTVLQCTPSQLLGSLRAPFLCIFFASASASATPTHPHIHMCMAVELLSDSVFFCLLCSVLQQAKKSHSAVANNGCMDNWFEAKPSPSLHAWPTKDASSVWDKWANILSRHREVTQLSLLLTLHIAAWLQPWPPPPTPKRHSGFSAKSRAPVTKEFQIAGETCACIDLCADL